jgi:uncharacterized protein YcsI (UPF0317 family)
MQPAIRSVDAPAPAAPAESRDFLADAHPSEVRAAIRSRRWTGVTHGMSRGYLHANLAIVPERHAFDFLRFCLRNPKPCPLVEVLDAGDPVPRRCAQGADIRTDLSKYRVYRDGRFAAEVDSLLPLWRDDHVAFLLGCSLSFDLAMLDAGIRLRHLEEPDGRISVYTSSIPCTPAGVFSGPMVVSMRPIPRRHLVATIETTARHPIAHGSPVHVGEPADIGIRDLTRVDWGRYNPVHEDEVPVFWACGVTPQAVAMACGIPELIAHSAGHMFITDLTLAKASVLA